MERRRKVDAKRTTTVARDWSIASGFWIWKFYIILPNQTHRTREQNQRRSTRGNRSERQEGRLRDRDKLEARACVPNLTRPPVTDCGPGIHLARDVAAQWRKSRGGQNPVLGCLVCSQSPSIHGPWHFWETIDLSLVFRWVWLSHKVLGAWVTVSISSEKFAHIPLKVKVLFKRIQ